MSEYTADFALVGEGVTDHAVLKNILRGYLKGQPREPRFTARQPDRDATADREWQQYGNWENVFRYLREGHHRDALQFNYYLVVQVDTDCSEHPNFGVSRRVGGRLLKVPVFVEQVVERIRREIGEADCKVYGNRLLFAVCVDSLECWLLPLWADQEVKQAKTTGCLETLNHGLRKQNQPAINPSNKRAQPYEKASSGYRNRRELLSLGRRNPSLGLFLNSLDAGKITLEADQ
jgi:hypothetical protein